MRTAHMWELATPLEDDSSRKHFVIEVKCSLRRSWKVTGEQYKTIGKAQADENLNRFMNFRKPNH